MEKFFIDENREYGLEYSKAVRATDQMHQMYHEANVQLSDADFVIEDTDFIMVIEYKNANTEKALELSYKTKSFNPMDADKLYSIVRKFYDSCHFLYLSGNSKPVWVKGPITFFLPTP